MTPEAPATAEPAGIVSRLVRRLEDALLAIVLGAMIVLAASQVLLRDVVGQGIAWGDEALRLMVLWAAMLGAVAASRSDAHLRIDVMSRILPVRARNVVAAIVDLFTAGVAGVLAFYSAEFVLESREAGEQVLISLPAWPFQAVLPVAFALIALRYLAWSVRRLRPEAAAGQGRDVP